MCQFQQIIFQHVDEMISNENSFLYDFILTFFSSLLAFAGAWGIMKIQIGRERRVQQEIDRQANIGQLRHFCSQTDTVLKACEQRLADMWEYVAKQNENLYEDAIFKRRVLFCLNRLLNDDSHELREALVHLSPKTQWDVNFEQFYLSLDSLKGIVIYSERIDVVRGENSLETKKRFQHVFESVASSMQMHAMKLYEILGEARYENNEYKWLDEYLQKRTELLHHDNDSIKPMNVWNAELIVPFLERLIGLEGTQSRYMYLNDLKECRVQANHFKTNIEFHLEQFSTYIEMIESQIGKLRNSKLAFEEILKSMG